LHPQLPLLPLPSTLQYEHHHWQLHQGQLVATCQASQCQLHLPHPHQQHLWLLLCYQQLPYSCSSTSSSCSWPTQPTAASPQVPYGQQQTAANADE
jgi:hypothetical protein